MKKISVECLYDYVSGYLKYGHLEGELELTDEQFEELKNDPIGFYQQNDYLFEDLKLVIDDCDVEFCGDINEILYKEIK